MSSVDSVERSESTSSRFPAFRQHFDTSAHAEHLVERRLSRNEEVRFYHLVQPEGVYRSPAVGDVVLGLIDHGRARITYDVGGGRISGECAPGSIILTPSGVDGEYRPEAPLGLNLLSLGAGYLDEFKLADGRGPDFGPLLSGPFSDRLITDLCTRLWAELASESPHGAIFVEHAAVLILYCLLSKAGRPIPSFRGGLSPRQLRIATEMLGSDLQVTVSLRQVASALDLSIAHFCRAFRRSTGIPPYRWLVDQRIDTAKLLMTDPKLTLAAIAVAVGYTNPSSFSAAFKRTTGQTPSDYRLRR